MERKLTKQTLAEKVLSYFPSLMLFSAWSNLLHCVPLSSDCNHGGCGGACYLGAYLHLAPRQSTCHAASKVVLDPFLPHEPSVVPITFGVQGRLLRQPLQALPACLARNPVLLPALYAPTTRFLTASPPSLFAHAVEPPTLEPLLMLLPLPGQSRPHSCLHL